MCVERSQTTTLDVTVDASGWGLVHLGCTCKKDILGRLLPNKGNPCEWHFLFEALIAPERSERIRALDIDFHMFYYGEKVELVLGSCRFFSLSFPQLTSLGWKAGWTGHSGSTFSSSPFTPTIRSLSFEGSWDGFFTQAKNLTSLTFVGCHGSVNVGAFRSFMQSNCSVESLSLDIPRFDGVSNGAPVNLPNIKSFDLHFSPEILSTIIHVPAIQRLSSLQISLVGVPDIGAIALTAAGDEIAILVKTTLRDAIGVWQGLTRDARPTIGHVRFCNFSDSVRDAEHDHSDGSPIIPLLADAHTLEIGRNYLLQWYPAFLDDLKQLGPQVKTIRFEVPEDTEPFRERGDVYERRGGRLLDQIEELVKYRFEHGCPFSVVERMVVGENRRTGRIRDYIWGCFYGDRGLSRYVRPE